MLFPETIKYRLARHQRVPMPAGPVPAAVLLPLFKRDGSWHILFTKRTEKLNHHSGEISFPGGVCDPEDLTPQETALRETREEVGIAPEEVEVLGALDDVYSIHNYLVTPYVGVFPENVPLVPNPAEIERLIEIPVDHLLKPGVFRSENWTWKGRTTPVFFYRYREEEVWGLTAAILKQFLDIAFPTAHRKTTPLHLGSPQQEELCLKAS